MHPPFDGDVVLVGCGRLGSAILEGWMQTGAVDPARLTVFTPSSKPAAEDARMRGARLNPSPASLASTRVVLLAVKPGKWREAIEPLIGRTPRAVVVSVMAGVRAADIASLAGRPVARLMPTTAVADARGVAALWTADPQAEASARALFTPLADVVPVEHEAQMDPATAVAGSAPAFLHAFVQALAEAGEAHGLPAAAASRLARGALRSAAAGLESGETLDALIARIASPGGTTRAGLDAMQDGRGLQRAASAAVDAAVARAKALSA